MQRLIAFLILLIPGLISVYGIKLLRDTVFGIVHPLFPNLVIQFVGGTFFFVAGLAFVGGFIFHRDRKRNKVQDRFKKKASLISPFPNKMS